MTWHVLGASVTGTSHLRAGRGCDDAHLARITNNNTLLLAVADGAGSASQSARGAAAAVRAAIEKAEATLTKQRELEQPEQWQNLLKDLLQAAHLAIQNLLQTEPANNGQGPQEYVSQQESDRLSLRDFATTLLITIITRQWIAIAQVGDGIAVAHYDDGTVASLYARPPQHYINETDFITDPAYLSNAVYYIKPRAGLRGIALLTDGLELLATTYPEHTAHPAFFLPFFKFATSSDATEEELRKFLGSERVNNRTDDDKTLLLAVFS
ncbi:MAG: PP2C family serine/threonine-protein phosphatase [Ktedonobacteraceae bacterium]